MNNVIDGSFRVKPGARLVPGFIRDIWNTAVPPVGKALFKCTLPIYVCGSSGATCALIGASTVLISRDFVCFYGSLIRDYFNKVAGEYKRTGRLQLIQSTNNMRKKEVFRLVIDLYSIFTRIAYLLSEYALIHPSSSKLSSHFHERLAEILKLASVCHVAHFQGAIYGATFATTFGVAVPYFTHTKIRRSFII